MGRRTRDPVREPISLEDLGSIEYLKKFVSWVEDWEKMADISKSLSKESFMTIIQTCKGLIGVSIYLLEEKGFDYVLLGMISSDPIERRFGWYRQLSGANYYFSVRQFLESEKKIRIQTLIKFGDLSFSDACEVLKSVFKM